MACKCEDKNNCKCNEGSEVAEPKLRHVGIQSFELLDVDEKYGPPAQPVLTVAVIGDVVSLAIDSYEETHEKRVYHRIASIIVDVEPLYNGLMASMNSSGYKSE